MMIIITIYIMQIALAKLSVNGGTMLKTSEERTKLLRAGFTGEAIEKLYIENNNFKIVNTPILFELVELDILQARRTASSEIAVGCA